MAAIASSRGRTPLSAKKQVCMASRPGRVYTRSQLLELVRDYEAIEADERTINVHISHIRDKIEPDPAQPRYIKTVRGVGYAFSED